MYFTVPLSYLCIVFQSKHTPDGQVFKNVLVTVYHENTGAFRLIKYHKSSPYHLCAIIHRIKQVCMMLV